MTTLSGMNSYFLAGAIQGYSDAVAPLRAFSYAVNQQGAVLGDIVRVPYCNCGTASNAFTYAAGYSVVGSGNVTAKSITLDTLLYQPINLTDADMALMSPEVVTRLGNSAGMQLAADFVSASFAAVITDGNFPLASNSGSNAFLQAAFTSSLGAWAEADSLANTAKWPQANRSMIASNTLWNSIIQNTVLGTAYSYGGTELVRNGTLPAVMGFTPYRTSVTLPQSIKGFLCNPDALLVGMAYHRPTDTTGIVEAAQATDEFGITIGYRSWYDPAYARTRKVIEVLGGFAVGNPNGLKYVAK